MRVLCLGLKWVFLLLVRMMVVVFGVGCRFGVVVVVGVFVWFGWFCFFCVIWLGFFEDVFE